MTKKNAEMTFEDRMRRLQSIVATLENGDASLEESVNLFKEGLALTAACREQLAAARNEILVHGGGTLPARDAREDDGAGDGGDGGEGGEGPDA
jgi:exodeoxyribonuclease VII small subunit